MTEQDPSTSAEARVPLEPRVRTLLPDHNAHVIDRLRYFGFRPDLCPQFWAHDSGPPGYSEWFEWADRMEKTHRQRQCPGCGLYAIWTPRGADEPWEQDDFAEYDSAF